MKRIFGLQYKVGIFELSYDEAHGYCSQRLWKRGHGAWVDPSSQAPHRRGHPFGLGTSPPPAGRGPASVLPHLRWGCHGLRGELSALDQVPLPSSRASGFPERSRHRRLAFWRQRTMRKEINVFVRLLTFESWSPPIRKHFHRGNQLKFKSV